MRKCAGASTPALQREIEEIRKAIIFVNITFDELNIKSEASVQGNATIKKEHEVLRAHLPDLCQNVAQPAAIY